MATSGSSAEFADWVRPSLLAMTRLARRLAPDHDPDDVVQDALLQAWRKWQQYDAGRGTPTTWLLAITADRARDARRTRRRHLQVVDDTSAAPEAAAEPRDTDADLDLNRAVQALPERQQLAVTLHYFVGLTVAECAAVMGCAGGTVKSTLYDARATLRQALGDGNEQ